MEKDWNGIVIKISEEDFKNRSIDDKLWLLLLGQKKACGDIQGIKDHLLTIDDKGCIYGKVSYKNIFRLLYVLLAGVVTLALKSIF